MQQITEQMVIKTIQPRPQNSFKGTFGHVLIVAGNQNLGGAAIMSASGAVYSGAGLVTTATDPSNFASLHAQLPESMVVDYTNFSQLQTLIKKEDVIVIGSGLGVSEQSWQIVNWVLNQVEENQILIIDGSAIDMIAQRFIQLPTAHIIFTPHQVEWEKLSGLSIPEQTVQNNQKAQQQLNATVVLKQHRTQIYYQNEVWENPVGSAALATGGSGDTLTGILAGFCAQFPDYKQAILSGVYTHSKVSDILAQTEYVTLPTRIVHELPKFMKQMSEKNKSK